ncbi:endonuclease/exonuclease/phosphatase family protein [Candidatus Dojkabacteria bacterium]|nr:endonuclease/exonuclease/phosphatase family protein [Candidatus Dojkabacteria bacterium]
MNIKNTKTKHIIRTFIILILLAVQSVLSVLIYNKINSNYDTPIVITDYSEGTTVYPINSCTKVAKANPNELNVVTYNIGDDQHICTKCDPKDRVKLIKDLMEANYVDIIGFQEIQLIKRKTNSTPEYVLEEYKQFMSQFSQYNIIYRGHGDKKGVPATGLPNTGTTYGNMIITKFPIRNDTYKEYIMERFPSGIYDDGIQRYLFSVIIDTPSGPLRVYNIHTRSGKESAWGVTEVVKFITQVSSTEKDIPFIVLGDFNQNIPYVQSQIENPQNGLGMTVGCQNPDICYTGHIDFIFPNSKVTMINRCKGVSQFGKEIISGGHVPVYATIKLLNVPSITPTFLPSNIPTPGNTLSPTITITEKAKYDLNADGEIDIQDFMKFVEYYKASDCKIDYNNNNNCKDITDFMSFSEFYRGNQ